MLVLPGPGGAGRGRLHTALAQLVEAGFAGEVWALRFGEEAGAPPPAGCHLVEVQVEGEVEPEGLVPLLEALCERCRPDVCLFESGTLGNALCTRLAHRRGAAALNDGTGLGWGGDVLLARKPVYGGNLGAEYRLPLPACLTLRPEEFEAGPQGGGPHSREVLQWRVEPGPGYRVLGREAKAENPLLAAKIVVAVGQGLGGRREVERLKALEERLGFVLGGTRPAVQNGWLPHERLIGTTGVSVAPELLVALGVSGAGAFMAGAKFARRIVAVNTDPDAPIFRYANRGILADGRELAALWEGKYSKTP